MSTNLSNNTIIIIIFFINSKWSLKFRFDFHLYHLYHQF